MPLPQDQTRNSKTTVKWSNLFTGTPISVLFWAGTIEGIITIIQSAEWLQDYLWWPRLLPVAQFVVSQIKMFISRDVEGAPESYTVSGDNLTVEKDKDAPK